MKGKYPYRTKHPNFSHQLEHVGPTKQISEVHAHRICYLAPLQVPCANNRKGWQDLHKLVAKKNKEGKIQGYWLSTIYSSILQGLNPWSPRSFLIWIRYIHENTYTHEPQV